MFYYIVLSAITEGRGSATGEVGLASLDIFSPALVLCQLTDTNSYIGTLRLINVLNPDEVRKEFFYDYTLIYNMGF